MTSEEIQRHLDELEAKRTLMREAFNQRQMESDLLLASIRSTAADFQRKVVQNTIGTTDGTRNKRNTPGA